MHDDFVDSFDALAGIAHRVAYRILGDHPEAQDVAQETLIRALTQWPTIRAFAERWVVRVATNLALDIVKHRRRRDVRALVPDSPTEDTWREVRVDLQRALRRLPRRQLEVVALRYLADRSEAETAALLGLRVGTVRQHSTRALKTLRIDHTLLASRTGRTP